jgi:hypothetical protein
VSTKSKSQAKKLKRKVRLNSLLPQHNTRVRREHLDADYLKDIPKDALEWYAQFIDESVGGAVEKTKTGKVKAGYLHNTPELAKQCYDDNNRRNRDIYGVSRANGMLKSIDWEMGEEANDGWYVKNPMLTEDAIISHLDEKNNPEEALLSFKEYIMVRDQMKEEVRDAYDLHFSEQNPQSYLYYTVYKLKNLTETQLDRLIKNPKLFDKILEDAEFMERKKRSSRRTKSG